MPRRLRVAPHLRLDELESRYRQAKDGTQRAHYQTIWLLAKGKPTATVAEVTGYSLSWIYELVRSYNRRGPSYLGDQRRHNRGAEPLLNDEQQALLWQALQEPPADGGLWTGPKVAQWMSQLLGHKVSPQRGWEYLKAMDEHRLGLKPVLRAVWVPAGEQPIATVNWRREWLWLYGFVHPQSGETYWWIRPKVRIDLFNRVLADFAQHYGVGKNKRVILAMVRAGWHTSDRRFALSRKS